MKQVIQTLRGELRIEEVPAPVCRPGGILVRNVCSLVSAGTERGNLASARRSLAQRALDRPDLAGQILRKAREEGPWRTLRLVLDRLESPLPVGYSASGIVYATGGDVDFKPGDAVCCAGGGYACHAEMIWVPNNLCVPLPRRRASGAESSVDPGVPISFEEGAFGTLGAVALHGVRQADIRVGETAAVVGLGLVGLLTVQIVKASGARVVGVDPDPDRVRLALALGADEAVCGGRSDCPGGTDAAVAAAARTTFGLGVDAVLVTASADSAEPLALAAELCRDRGRVVVVGAVRTEFSRQVYYDKELEIRLSRSYGPGRYDPTYEEQGMEYPVGYVRLTERKTIRAILYLVAEGEVSLRDLITHRLPIADALQAYELLEGKRREPYLAMLITYPQTEAATATTIGCLTRPSNSGAEPSREVRLGLIGAGSFAQNTLIPILKRMPDIRWLGVATQSGCKAKHLAVRNGFSYGTTRYEEILSDPQVNAVLIATRHDLHARLVAQTLQAGKHVFVEKPLCVTPRELDELQDRIRAGAGSGLILQVGFNRRFSPWTVKAREFFRGRNAPISLHYRVNAGEIPRDHWVQDPAVGGGRIIGEVCHFVDFCSFVIGFPPVRVSASRIAGDSVVVHMEHADGSVSTVHYLDNGASSLPKERVEMVGNASAFIIDDFRRAEWFSTRGKGRGSAWGQDKGHRAELEAFRNVVISGGAAPVDPEEFLRTTRVTFAIQEALTRKGAVEIA